MSVMMVGGSFGESFPGFLPLTLASVATAPFSARATSNDVGSRTSPTIFALAVTCAVTEADRDNERKEEREWLIEHGLRGRAVWSAAVRQTNRG